MMMKKVGRNDPCPCGSGKKYKQCCQQQEAPQANPAAVDTPLPHLLQAGLQHHQAGRLAQAAALYRQILEAAPSHPEALHLSGVIAYQEGNHALAAERIGQAIQTRPSSAMWCNLGLALQAQGQLDAAVDGYRQALLLQPDHAEAHYNLGNALTELGQPEAAIAHYRQALALKPGFAEAHGNLGNALKTQGWLAAAADSYQQALAIKPDYVEALSNLGLVRHEQGRLDAAVEHYRKALAFRPDLTTVHFNLGNALRDQHKLDAAVEHYRKALALQPDFAEVYVNLSVLQRSANLYYDAFLNAQRAVELNPGIAAAHQDLAMTLSYLSDYSKVTEHCDAALAIEPNDYIIWENRLYLYSYHPDLSAEDIFAEFVRWGDRFPSPPTDTFASHDRSPDRRLRVGYVSPDFRRHTSRFFFESLFKNHDRNQVELFAYSNVLVEDNFTEQFKEMFDHWRHIRGVSGTDVAAQIRNDKIDILVDGCSHMADDRLDVFVHKPAPIQVTWLGSAWTSGLPTMDYVLFDRHMAPEGTLAREKIVRIPCIGAFHPLEETLEIAPPPAIKNGYVTFGYSGRSERLNHRVLHTWGEILRRVPNARLILDFAPFADPATQNYYQEFLAKHGIDATRVTMRRSANIFEGLADFDILLDSFPHNGGTMISDAVWMGVPLLTLASRPPVGMIGAAVMSHLGLKNWIATSEAEYVDKAVQFAADVAYLKALRPQIRERLKNSLLMNKAGFAQSFDMAYRKMWQLWCSGQLPCDLNIESESESATLKVAV